MKKNKFVCWLTVSLSVSSSALAINNYQFVPITDNEVIQKSYIGVKFNINLPYASIEQTERNTGYYGLGIDAGNLYQLDRTNALGYSVGFNFNDRSSFATNTGNLITASLYDFNALGHYQLSMTDKIKANFSFGLAYVFGWVNHYITNYYGRFEPVLGISAGYDFTNHFFGFVGYQHYFGVSSDSAFSNHRSAPSLNRFEIGGRYVF